MLTTNAADDIFNVSGVLPGVHRGNVGNVVVRDMLVDPDELNFRPVKGSLLDKSGASAYSADDDESSYWIPGRRRGTTNSGRSDVSCDGPTCDYWRNVRKKVGATVV